MIQCLLVDALVEEGDANPVIPHHRSAQRVATSAFVCSLTLLLYACDTNPSVTDPDRPMVVFEGQLTTDASNEHELIPEDSGAARFEVTALTATPALPDDPTLFVDVAIGRPSTQEGEEGEEGEAECDLTFDTILREGGSFLIDLSTITYCVVVSDDGGRIPEDTTFDYTLLVSLPN